MESTCKPTRCQSLEEQHRHPQRRENIKSHVFEKFDNFELNIKNFHTSIKHVKLPYFTKNYTTNVIVVEWLALLLSIQEVPGSNLRLETGFLD